MILLLTQNNTITDTTYIHIKAMSNKIKQKKK